MVKPGMQMAEKMPDAYIQLWGASLLRGTYVYQRHQSRGEGAEETNSREEWG